MVVGDGEGGEIGMHAKYDRQGPIPLNARLDGGTSDAEPITRGLAEQNGPAFEPVELIHPSRKQTVSWVCDSIQFNPIHPFIALNGISFLSQFVDVLVNI